MSRESAPRSLVKLASVVTSDSSTPNLSTIIAFTLDAISDKMCIRDRIRIADKSPTKL